MPPKRSNGGPAAPRRPKPGRMGTKDLERLFADRGFTDFRWIDPREIVVAEWVRMKCLYGCVEYGKNAACPPNAPPVDTCARFFREYKRAAVFHFGKKVDRPEDRHAWGRKLNLELLKLEAEVFKGGFVKAFLLFFDSCGICLECASARATCKELRLSRPTPDALAMDVYSTVRKIGYPIEVLSDYDQEMNRYAFLLID
jgi:predicted metal-binding protein